MQMNRLFEMVYLLMERGNMTASELARRFEVSTRTIYRDVETLSEAGIPIYACKGKGGGIRLMEDFVLDRSLLSKAEQNSVMASLRALEAVRVPDMEPVVTKLAGLFGQQAGNWLEVDFSSWGGGEEARRRFELLKEAILTRKVVAFSYHSATSGNSKRQVEPLKLLFKGQGWYLYGYCRQRGEERVFKLSRMGELEMLGEPFSRVAPAHALSVESTPFQGRWEQLRLRFQPGLAYRVLDEFAPDQVLREPSGSFLVETKFPTGEWLFQYLLGFGAGVEVLDPPPIRDEMQKRLKKTLEQYL